MEFSSARRRRSFRGIYVPSNFTNPLLWQTGSEKNCHVQTYPEHVPVSHSRHHNFQRADGTDEFLSPVSKQASQPGTGSDTRTPLPQNIGECLHKREGDWRNGNPILLWDCDAGPAENKTWRLAQ